MFYVYKKFRSDGSLCYVGKGHGDRYRDKNNRNPDLRALIDAGCIITKIVRRGLTETAALHLERSMIRSVGLVRDGGILFNRTTGGQDVTKLKIGVANLGQRRSSEARAKMSAWQVGRVMSVEARVNMSAAAKERFSDPAERAKSVRKNKFVSTETRAKLSTAAKAQWSRV